MVSCVRHRVERWWKHFVIILTPLVLLLPLLLIPEETLPKKANQSLYVMLLMAVYWVTEAMALYVTACIPIFLFPLLGILTAGEVADQFLTPSVIMFVGGLMVAIAVEKCNLHKWIAVGILHVVGTKPLWLMLGFMLPTGGLSMWISNTAATAMMLPISEAVLDSLKNTNDKKRQLIDHNAHQAQMELIKKGPPQDNAVMDTSEVDLEGNKSNDEFKNTKDDMTSKFAKGLTLAICYSANVGGTATLVGTPPNAIMKEQADMIWQGHGYDESTVTFASWMTLGVPVSLICLIFVWLWLTVFYNGIRSLIPFCTKSSEDDDIIKGVIEEEYRAMGKLTFAQITVALIFILMVLLWFFRSPSFMIGWGDTTFFKPGYTHDAVISMFIVVLLCAIPSKLPTCRRRETGPTNPAIDMLLDWHTIQAKFPWGVIFLVGGGFCLAKASMNTGLSAWIAESLTLMANLPGWVMVFVICLTTAFMTEITSNSATTTILMPIVGSLAEQVGYSPLYLMVPVCLSASFAFMLPAATVPNALSFASGRIRIIDMMKGGLILNFLCVGVVTFANEFWGVNCFNMFDIPWAVNNTTAFVT